MSYKDLISVTTMSVSMSKDNRLLWITLPGVLVFSDYGEALREALALAAIHKVGAIFDLHKGEEVTQAMHHHLIGCGLLDHLL